MAKKKAARSKKGTTASGKKNTTGGSKGTATSPPKDSKASPKPPDTVKEITKFEGQRAKLEAQLAEARENLSKSLTLRREELVAARDVARKDYETKDAALRAEMVERDTKLRADFEAVDVVLRKELDDISTKLGTAPEVDIPVAGPADSTAVPDDEYPFEYYDIAMPKGLELPEGIEWNQLCQIRFEPTSLDQHIVKACVNAGDGTELHVDVIAAVAEAMGHESGSANFKASVSTRCSYLKNSKKYLKAGSKKGHFIASKPGIRWIEKLTAQAEEIAEGSCESFVLQAVAANDGPLSGTDMGKAVQDQGFNAPDDPAEYRKVLGSALKFLQRQQLITVEADKNRSQVTATAAGKKYAQALS